uniref:DUF1279 domain-containing protein n=1 Tax=Triticum urartu TaxID=4572 RepID=A0A8R7UKX2_TRIUA
MAFTARMKDLMRKYGKVALGVHVSVSVASVSGALLQVLWEIAASSPGFKVYFPGHPQWSNAVNYPTLPSGAIALV